jgi:hypothetical protein
VGGEEEELGKGGKGLFFSPVERPIKEPGPRTLDIHPLYGPVVHNHLVLGLGQLGSVLILIQKQVIVRERGGVQRHSAVETDLGGLGVPGTPVQDLDPGDLSIRTEVHPLSGGALHHKISTHGSVHFTTLATFVDENFCQRIQLHEVPSRRQDREGGEINRSY